MRRLLLVLFMVCSFSAMSSCTNDEGDEDIDVIIPNDDDDSLALK
jgi:hypothetical protein